MGQTLTEIAETLRDADKKVQLIYAFNASGKTRLSREFRELIDPKTEARDDGIAPRCSTTTLSQKICSTGTTILRETLSASSKFSRTPIQNPPLKI